MGIHDRDYYRQPPSHGSFSGPRTMVGMLILINVVFFFANGLITPPSDGIPAELMAKLEKLHKETPGVDPVELLTPRERSQLFSHVEGWITHHMAVKAGTLFKPWMWWQFVTYGFAHAPFPRWEHIVGNMLVLFFLARDIEMLYGRKEFLRLYLALLVVAGVVWAVIEQIQGVPAYAGAVGASGAVTGIVVLYALNFPRRTLLLFFVIPMPAWVAGVLVVGLDMFGALGKGGTEIAYTAHLGGAAFAFLYYRSGWKLSAWNVGWVSSGPRRRRPSLRVHDPDRRARQDQEMSDEVDRILEKISREGEDSLTRRERRTLENASREYQKRRGGPDDETL